MKWAKQKRIFDDWLAQHRGLLFKVVRAYSNQPADQEDLFQEIALQMWNSVPRFKGKSKVSTWIYRVAFFTASTWKRDERKHRAANETFEEGQHTLIRQPRSGDARLDWLFEQIQRLHEPDRSIALLMLDGCSYAEMAEVIGMSESNIGVRINRIKKQLSQISKEEQYSGLQ